jgi:hypothetical protein
MAGYGYNLIQPLSVISNSADQVDYPASNLLLPSIDRPWYAAGVGSRSIDFDFGAPTVIDGVYLNDVNIASVGIATGDSLAALTNQTAMTLYRASHGRWRGLSRFQQTKRFVRLTFNAATQDGLAYYRGGSVLFWGAWASLVPPNFGISVSLQRAQARIDMANQRTALSTLAKGIDEINMAYEHKLSEIGQVADFIERASAGPVVFDLQHSFRPWYMWALRIVDERSSEQMDKVRLATRQILCQEVA